MNQQLKERIMKMGTYSGDSKRQIYRIGMRKVSINRKPFVFIAIDFHIKRTKKTLFRIQFLDELGRKYENHSNIFFYVLWKASGNVVSE